MSESFDKEAYAHMREHGIHRQKKNGEWVHETVGGKPFKAKALKKKTGWEQKGGINEHGKYCNHCASSSHKSGQHAGLVKEGKLSR